MKEIGLMIKKMEKAYCKYIIGIATYTDGEMFDGDWKNGKRNGKGNLYAFLPRRLHIF